MSDNQTVFLKCVRNSSPEIDIGRYLSRPEVQDDPRNHAPPLLDVVEWETDVENVILVMPLMRELYKPPFASVRECMDFVGQLLEGLAFFHQLGIAHRDCAAVNIMMEGRGLLPQGWHAQSPGFRPDGSFVREDRHVSRTAIGGVRYHFLDFGISTKDYNQALGCDGRIQAPELSAAVPYDPYKVDVYALGTMFRTLLVEKHPELKMILPLVEIMTVQHPSERSSAQEAYETFKSMRGAMGTYVLGRRLRQKYSGLRLIRALGDIRYRLWDFWWSHTSRDAPSLRPLI